MHKSRKFRKSVPSMKSLINRLEKISLRNGIEFTYDLRYYPFEQTRMVYAFTVKFYNNRDDKRNFIYVYSESEMEVRKELARLIPIECRAWGYTLVRSR